MLIRRSEIWRMENSDLIRISNAIIMAVITEKDMPVAITDAEIIKRCKLHVNKS